MGRARRTHKHSHTQMHTRRKKEGRQRRTPEKVTLGQVASSHWRRQVNMGGDKAYNATEHERVCERRLSPGPVRTSQAGQCRTMGAGETETANNDKFPSVVEVGRTLRRIAIAYA